MMTPESQKRDMSILQELRDTCKHLKKQDKHS